MDTTREVVQSAREPVRSDLIDEDGENRAVRAFLSLYQGGATTVGTMARHMECLGWASEPAWVNGADSEPLTKAGAQLWIRHLLLLEDTQPNPAPEPVAHQTCVTNAGQALPIEKVIEWASQAGFTWRNPARDRCLAEFAELVQVFGSEPLRDLTDAELDTAIDRSGWPQNMISDFIRDKLREACRFALAAATEKVNPKVNSGGIHGKA